MMLGLLYDSVLRLCTSLWCAVCASVLGLVSPKSDTSAPRSVHVQRLLVLVVGLPLFLTLQAVHWICFVLDEVCFPSYRQMKLKEPVFVLGVPRSGTTFLHKTLQRDSRYTTFSVWECLFAPSIFERKIILGVVLDVRR